MAEGPGKYDDLATLVRVSEGAAGVVVLVVGGRRGNGFSVQTTDPSFVKKLPGLLRLVADQIDKAQNAESPADPVKGGGAG